MILSIDVEHIHSIEITSLSMHVIFTNNKTDGKLMAINAAILSINSHRTAL